uniref:SprT-like domain-containing protein n=1 Tax=Thermosporothrix sp. COM3 TaxID=2490863 RepID=A0A455SQA4_9CHLR|nr:hypothetical protein KTC_46410 [Thermosporothrix sp. COM3]
MSRIANRNSIKRKGDDHPHSMRIVPKRLELASYLEDIWQRYFSDVQRPNEIYIGYCFPWKTRLGLIRLALDNSHSFIGINSLLQLANVPESVLITTIAHELVHYAHGFGSPLPRAQQHPHANGIVEKELEARSLGPLLQECNEWLDHHWYPFYEEQKARGRVRLLSALYTARRQTVL